MKGSVSDSNGKTLLFFKRFVSISAFVTKKYQKFVSFLFLFCSLNIEAVRITFENEKARLIHFVSLRYKFFFSLPDFLRLRYSGVLVQKFCFTSLKYFSPSSDSFRFRYLEVLV